MTVCWPRKWIRRFETHQTSSINMKFNSCFLYNDMQENIQQIKSSLWSFFFHLMQKCGVQSIWICNLCAVCMGVKIGLLLEGKNIKGYLRTGFWGKMLWPKEVQIPGRCRERHDEEFCGLFSAVNDIRACFLKLCGTCISTGMPTIGCWYVALIKNQK